jgi:hypothetical protein
MFDKKIPKPDEGPSAMVMSFDVEDAMLEVEGLQALWAVWRAAKAQRGDLIPARSDIDIADLRAAMGNLCLLDVVDGGADFRYRVYGTNITLVYEQDMTGRCVSELQPKSDRFFLEVYRSVVNRAKPLFCRSTAHKSISAHYWDRLFVPLAKDGVHVDQVMTAAVPRAMRRSANRYL